jgi:C-terminal processing protease CtpA/Prc
MKVHITSRLWQFVALLPLLAVLQACPPKEDPPVKDEEAEKIAADPDYKAKDFLRKEYMDVYYYWRDQVKSHNANLKPYNYDIYDFFEAMLYDRDHWSWMCDKEYYVSSETGVYNGTWGVSLGQAVRLGDYSVYIRYMYPGSPFEQFGVTRGAKITHINGVNVMDDEEGFTQAKLSYFNENYNVSPQKFTFRLADGRDTTFTATKAASLATRPGLITRVFQPGDFPGLTEPVGYFHYLSFLANFLDDIDNAMKTFHDAGVKKAIIDLRYNGGGDSRASQRLIDYLAPKSAEGQPYVIRHHNDYLQSQSSSYSDENNTFYVISSIPPEDEDQKAVWDKVYPNRLDLDAIYFITGQGSASASEMVMNGLRPYMGDKLQMVGDTTYGKPNGMYVFIYPGTDSDYRRFYADDFSNLKWVFLPICFYNMNSKLEAIPDHGFIPNNARTDDLFHDFGVEEDLIKACLTRIATGSYPPVKNVKTKAVSRSGARMQLEEDAPGYGRYVVRRPE